MDEGCTLNYSMGCLHASWKFRKEKNRNFSRLILPHILHLCADTSYCPFNSLSPRLCIRLSSTHIFDLETAHYVFYPCFWMFTPLCKKTPHLPDPVPPIIECSLSVLLTLHNLCRSTYICFLYVYTSGTNLFQGWQLL